MPEENKKDDVLLTEEEVWDVITFAKSYANGMYGGVLTPDLVNLRMRDVTLNPMQATQDQLDAALRDPKNNEPQFQAFSQSFEQTSMVYKRLMSYLSNMLAFDITYTSNADPEDYKTPKYKKDLTVVEDFLEKFEYKKEFRVVIREMLRNDAYFGCMVEAEDKYILQELPSQYCKITGRWKGGFLFSFNMYWFLQPGVDLNMYPPFFAKKYNEIWNNPNTMRGYNPALSPESRGSSSWVYWVDVPVDVGVCFKLTPELATRLPYFSPLFSDLILQPLIRNLQKNINMAEASKLIIGEIPLLNKDVKAPVRDSLAINPDLLGKFMALLRNAMTDAIKISSAPLNNIQGVSFDGDNTMYDSYLRTALATTGINTNLIFTSNIKPNAIETQLSLNVDEQMMTPLYSQFDDCVNYWVNKLTKTFKFILAFEGTDFFLDRQGRLDTATKMYNLGIIMPQKIAAAIGMKPAQMRKHMEEAQAMGFMKLVTPPSVVNQEEIIKAQPKPVAPKPGANPANPAGGKPAPKLAPAPGTTPGAGRPKKETSKLGDEGMNSRERATNVGRGGKVQSTS